MGNRKPAHCGLNQGNVISHHINLETGNRSLLLSLSYNFDSARHFTLLITAFVLVVPESLPPSPARGNTERWKMWPRDTRMKQEVSPSWRRDIYVDGSCGFTRNAAVTAFACDRCVTLPWQRPRTHWFLYSARRHR